MKLINMFVRRDYLKNKVLKTENDVRNVCYYCKYGDKCEKIYAIRSELKKKGFNSFLIRMCSFGMFIKIVFILNHYRQICECRNICFFDLGKSGSFLEKANMMILTKEATDKDRSIKSQLLLSSNNSDEKLSGERVWRSEGHFSDIRAELNLEKKLS